MAAIPLPSTIGVTKRVGGTDQAAGVEITDTVPVATNEVQTISGTPSGTFALTVDGTTGPATLTTTATAQNVQDYLNAFNAYTPNGVVCTGGPLPGAITITYSGAPAAQRNVSAPTVAGGITGLTITTTTQGSNAKSWYLFSVSVQLVQGITQTPLPVLTIDDGANIVYQSPGCSAALSASTTAQFTWAPGLSLGAGGAGTVQTASLPYECVLPSGFRIRTVTTGIGANTNYGAPSYLVCELG